MAGEQIEEGYNKRSNREDHITTKGQILSRLRNNRISSLPIIRVLHRLESIQCLLLGIKEDTHRGNTRILLVGVDKQTLALDLEGTNHTDIDQTIPIRDVRRGQLHRGTADISEVRHFNQRETRGCTRDQGATAIQIYCFATP